MTSTVTTLWERTEGWAAALQLAALTRARNGNSRNDRADIGCTERHILDYLMTEIVDRFATDQRDLLVRTSVLERLNGPLCDYVLGRDGSAESAARARQSRSARGAARSGRRMVQMPSVVPGCPAA